MTLKGRGQRQHASRGDRVFLGELHVLGQSVPLDQLHCYEQKFVGFADLVHRNDVGMGENGNGFGLLLEKFGRLRRDQTLG